MRLAVLLGLSIALAGCITATPPEPLVPADVVPGALVPTAPAVSALDFHGCVELAGIFPVPSDLVAQDLPEGFAPATLDPSGQVGFAFATGFRCHTPVAEAAGEEEVAEFHLLWGVVPPAEYQVEGLDLYLVALIGITTSPAHAEVYRAWAGGEGDEPATIEVAVLQDTPAARAAHVMAQTPAGTMHLYGASEGPFPATPEGKARAFYVRDDGTPSHAIDVQWSGGSHATNGQVAFRYEGLAVPPLPPPAYPGLALQWWGDDYQQTWRFVNLSAVAAPEAPEPGPAPPLPPVARLLAERLGIAPVR